MITLTREEAQQVLDALEKISMGGHPDWANDVTPILRARLAQPEPKPVAWIKKDRSSIEVSIMSAEYMRNEGFEPLYTAPPQREWHGLTDEEIMEMLDYGQYGRVPEYARNFVDAIEAKLKEKNG